jgi:hypothetical protein
MGIQRVPIHYIVGLEPRMIPSRVAAVSVNRSSLLWAVIVCLGLTLVLFVAIFAPALASWNF